MIAVIGRVNTVASLLRDPKTDVSVFGQLATVVVKHLNV